MTILNITDLRTDKRQHNVDYCILCGKPTKGWKYAVHCVNGWLEEIIPVDQEWPDEASEMGMWPIGPECRKKLPAEYVRIYDS